MVVIIEEMFQKKSKVRLPIPFWLRLYIKFSKIFKKDNIKFEIDSPRNIREGESVPVEAIANALNAEGFNTDGLSIKQFPSGFSNLTYFIKTNEHELVLRRPPYGADSLKGGHDMFREYDILKQNLKKCLMFIFIPMINQFLELHFI